MEFKRLNHSLEDERYKHKSIWIWLLSGMILGFVSFIFMYGYKVINWNYDAFLINQGADLTQNYLGWIFYRFASAENSFGMMDTMTYPKSISIMYTDSAPLIELIFKPFSDILPDTFQYFGLLGALNYAMSGGLAAVIIKKWTDKFWLTLLCTLPFVFSMPMFIKMFHHHQLTAHWVILLAFLIWVYQKENWGGGRRYIPVICWFGMGVLACSMHFYFVPMCGMIVVGYSLHMFLEDKKRWQWAIGVIIAYIMGALLFMAVIGGFKTDFFTGENYFEEYIEMLYICGANLNSFINAYTPSVFGRMHQFALKGQGEGLAYLGAGMLLAIVIAVGIRLWCAKKRGVNITALKISLFAVLILSIVIGVGPAVSWNEKVLFTIPYPEFLLKLWSTFRCTGRFIWPAFYILLLFAIKTLLTMGNKKVMYGLLVMCCVLQIVDFMPTIIDRHEMYSEYEDKKEILVEKGWEFIGEKYEHSVVLPNIMLTRGNERNYFAYWGGKNKVTLNDFYLARQVLEDQTDFWYNKIKEEGGDSDTVYIVNRQLLEKFFDCPLYWYQLDDFYVGTVEDISKELNKQPIDLFERKEWVWYDVDYSMVFDPTFYYYRYYGDLYGEKMSVDELWADFLNYGRYEGRQASANFDPQKYKERYGDVAEAYGDNWEMYYWHFAVYGSAEGRKGN